MNLEAMEYVLGNPYISQKDKERFSWTREEMIDEILRLSGDEFETKQDMITLAKESDEQLKERLKCLQSENQ